MSLKPVALVALAVALVFAGALPARAQSTWSVEGDFLRWQASTSVLVIGVESTTDKLANAVLLWNRGTTTLTKIRIGGALRDGTTTLRTVVSTNQTVSIAAGSMARVNLPGWTMSGAHYEMTAAGSSYAVFVVGVVTAEWSNGSTFAFDLASAGNFSGADRSDVDTALSAYTTDQLQAAMGQPAVGQSFDYF